MEKRLSTLSKNESTLLPSKFAPFIFRSLYISLPLIFAPLESKLLPLIFAPLIDLLFFAPLIDLKESFKELMRFKMDTIKYVIFAELIQHNFSNFSNFGDQFTPFNFHSPPIFDAQFAPFNFRPSPNFGSQFAPFNFSPPGGRKLRGGEI